MRTSKLAISAAILIDVTDAIYRVRGALETICAERKNCAEWLRIEISATSRTGRLRFAIKPTQRLRKLLAAAQAVGGDKGGIERPAGSPRVAHNLSRGGHGRKVTPRSVRKQSPGGAA